MQYVAICLCLCSFTVTANNFWSICTLVKRNTNILLYGCLGCTELCKVSTTFRFDSFFLEIVVSVLEPSALRRISHIRFNNKSDCLYQLENKRCLNSMLFFLSFLKNVDFQLRSSVSLLGWIAAIGQLRYFLNILCVIYICPLAPFFFFFVFWYLYYFLLCCITTSEISALCLGSGWRQLWLLISFS